MTADKLTVGQEVRVYDVNGRRMGQPDGGWVGHITKIGRKLITIQYGRREKAFRIEDARANDSYGHQTFLTLDEAARRDQDQSARSVLNAAGLTVDWRTSLSREQIIAVADLVRSFDPDSSKENDRG